MFRSRRAENSQLTDTAAEPVSEKSQVKDVPEEIRPVPEKSQVTDGPEEIRPVPENAQLTADELARRESGLAELVEMMRPAVQMDGGDLEVIDVDYTAGIVEVQLQGACGSCAVSATTLKGGVERLLKERLDWVSEVRGGVDDSLDPFESASMGTGGYVPRYY